LKILEFSFILISSFPKTSVVLLIVQFSKCVVVDRGKKEIYVKGKGSPDIRGIFRNRNGQGLHDDDRIIFAAMFPSQGQRSLVRVVFASANSLSNFIDLDMTSQH
jgi:hypothetical protein